MEKKPKPTKRKKKKKKKSAATSLVDDKPRKQKDARFAGAHSISVATGIKPKTTQAPQANDVKSPRADSGGGEDGINPRHDGGMGAGSNKLSVP